MQKTLLFIGIGTIILGISWPYISKIPLGKLPGDIIFERSNFKIFFPITTMVIISIVISIIAQIFRK